MNATEFAARLNISYRTALKLIKTGKVKTSGGGDGYRSHRGTTYSITEEQFSEFVVNNPKYDKRPDAIKPGPDSPITIKYKTDIADNYTSIPDTVKDSRCVVKQLINCRKRQFRYQDLANICTTTVNDILGKINGFSCWERRDIVRLAKFFKVDPTKLYMCIHLGALQEDYLFNTDIAETPEETKQEEAQVDTVPEVKYEKPKKLLEDHFVILEEVYAKADTIIATKIKCNYIFRSKDDAAEYIKKAHDAKPEDDAYVYWIIDESTYTAIKHRCTIIKLGEWNGEYGKVSNGDDT